MSLITPRRAGRGVAGRLADLAAEFTDGPLPIRVRAWDGSVAGPESGPTVVLRSRRALRRLLFHPGELGLAQAYVTGELDIEGDLLTGLRAVWAATRDAGLRPRRPDAAGWARVVRGAARLGVLGPAPAPPASQARLRGALHSRLRDRAAISHHYDLSNEFYALVLDPHMAYSCAYWTSAADGYTLTDAQTDKLDLICRKLGLQPGMRLLDVGCGWGSLLLHAVENYGVTAVGVTLSAQQRSFVQQRIAERGLGEAAQVRLQDYRELAETEPAGSFDAVASIEMGEHVGLDNYPAYAAALHRLVRETGRVLVQQMSRAGDAAPGGGPFIEAYIAPDMHMRPLGMTADLLAGPGLEVRDVEVLREHYVWTVRAWYDTFESRWDQVVALVGEEVARVWRLYLVGGALAFEEGRMGVDQFLLVKPTATGEAGIPRTRADWVRG